MLKTVIDTLDDVEDAVKPFYAESDGKFVLQVSGVDAHPEVVNLKTAYDKVKADREAVRKERDEAKLLADSLPDDFDPEKWSKLKDGKPDEAALIKLRQDLEGDRDQWKSKFEAAQQAARRNALDRDLTDALTEAGVTNPTFTKAARNMLADGVQVGDDGSAFVETDMGPIPLADHVKRWAAGEGKDFITPASGGGAKGNQGRTAKGGNALIERVPALADLPEK